MNKDPYLIVGTGRCGTSTVARILHENLGVYMGEYFQPPDKGNPQGYYEDQEFVSLNYQLYSAGIDYQHWLGQTVGLIKKRQLMRVPWGIKSLRIVELFGMYLGLFDNPKIILCTRDREDTIESILRSFKSNRKNANRLYVIRTTLIRRFLTGRDYLEIDFTERRNECEIERLIKEKWNDNTDNRN